MIAQFTIPLPPTLNQQIDLARTHWTKSSTTKKRWSKLVAQAAIGQPSFPDEVWITLDFTLHGYSTRDWDNTVASAKFILDGLKDAGVISDDNFSIVQDVSPFFRQALKVGKTLEPEQVLVTVCDRPLCEIKRLPIVVSHHTQSTIIRANSSIGATA